MNTATIFNVQRFSVHDGPGIRTTVFLKGCPLQCPWCHNPESMDARPQVAIKADRCLECGGCLEACPIDLAGPVEVGTQANRPDATCLRCGGCAEACPAEARDLMGRTMTVTDLMAELDRDRAYFEESGGGVTFSGGEPIAAHHAPFLMDCLEVLGRFGIHRTVDTCGHVPAATLMDVAAKTDLLLFDLKIMDGAAHKETLGVDNALIHENLVSLTEAGHEVIVRIPLIPGLTDTAVNLEAAAEFVADLEFPCPVQLLPYHGMAKDKYGRLGLEYTLTDLPDTPALDLESAAAPFTDRGVEVLMEK